MRDVDLVMKYAVPVPRYTSFPPVPKWSNETPSVSKWKNEIITVSENPKRASLYVHLPYCESLCTYCGCNTRITRNHAVEEPYLQTLLQEWNNYNKLLNNNVTISQLHLGGGTPTFFSASNLDKLVSGLIRNSKLSNDADLSFEAHPANTKLCHIKTMQSLGFRRISFGIQDFEPTVQKAINRFQTEEDVKKVVETCKEAGYTSINFDLVYGLPFQTMEGLVKTIEAVVRLRPNRIAFYSYAHVPWKKPSQRGYSEENLPDVYLKYLLNLTGRKMLSEAGYISIGMDHFALPSDSLSFAAIQHKLQRNFMGYTEVNSDLLIGLGASSISDLGYTYAQNSKKVEDYMRSIKQNGFALEKLHYISHHHQNVRKILNNLFCQFETSWDDQTETEFKKENVYDKLGELQNDGMLKYKKQYVQVAERGKIFIRNICAAFDDTLAEKNHQTYSIAV